MKKTLIIAVIALGMAMVAPAAHAACPVSTPIKDTADANGLSAHCPDGAQVAGYFYAVSAPDTVNSGAADVVCESVGGDGGVCLSGGVVGDNGVNFEGDWASAVTNGWNGCFTGLANPRLVAVVQAPDGSGFLASMSGIDVGFGYDFIVAHKIDPNTFEVFPFECGTGAGQPHIVSATSSNGTTSVNLVFDKPVIQSDCDADSYGKALAQFGFPDSCATPFDLTPAVGHIYTRVQLCTDTPPLDRGSWTLNAATLNADGSASVDVPQPSSQTDCAFIGSTLMVGGTESRGVTGYVRIAGALSASPRALDVRASQAGGKVVVSFRTDTELGLAKINILTTDKQGSRAVASASPKGIGGAGASYEISIDRSQIKGGKTIEVELVGVGGKPVFKSAPVGY